MKLRASVFFVFSTLIVLQIACSKKETPAIIPGRSLDSLQIKPYPERILAFAIELGKRSRDFDDRFDAIMERVQSYADWQNRLLLEVAQPAFAAIERHNLAYLDSVRALWDGAPDSLRSLIEVQNEGMKAFRDNYDQLHHCRQAGDPDELYDRKYRNDRIIQSAMMRVVAFFEEKEKK